MAGERGGAAPVEFASPVLILFMLGLIDVGKILSVSGGLGGHSKAPVRDGIGRPLKVTLAVSQDQETL